jgi:hypothetical protein
MLFKGKIRPHANLHSGIAECNFKWKELMQSFRVCCACVEYGGGFVVETSAGRC